MELHEALKKARQDAGLSVSSVAQHLAVGRAQVWRMEKNAEFISIARLRQVAELYGVPIEVLLDDSLPPQAGDVSYQLVGMAVDAVMAVIAAKSIQPAQANIRDAVVTVIRLQQRRWDDDPKSKFFAKEYTALIEEHLRGSES
ncbi:helix-turn-helix domain-containing protein [Octadecabacter sp.]|nr:helix-turn-helix domain-containing protein [Octadecabacter sp.]